MTETATPDDRSSTASRFLRFPSAWIVGSRSNENRFSKAVWLVLPLQYYVLSQFPTGLRGEYVAVALVAAVSIAALFLASLLFSLVLYTARGKGQIPAEEETKFGGTYAVGVRMWAIALIVSWACVHLVVALSYALGGQKGHLLDQLICGAQMNNFVTCGDVRPDLDALTLIEYAIYTAFSVGLLAAAAALHRRLSAVDRRKVAYAEPNIFYVILTVTLLLTAISSSTATH